METVMQLRPSPWKHLGLLAISAVFVAMGVFILPTQAVIGWLCIAFFGLGVGVALVTPIPGSSYLRLEPHRMSVRTLYRTWHVNWADVSGFFVAQVGGRAMVCWHYAPGFREMQQGRALARTLSGVEGGLPDTYGYSAEALAELLNQWRERGAVPGN